MNNSEKKPTISSILNYIEMRALLAREEKTLKAKDKVFELIANKVYEAVKLANKEHKTNPVPRIGTKKPMRKSQVTKNPPSKRLVKRRKKNTETGYFPNPEVHHRMSKKRPTMKIIRPEFHVRTKKDHMIVQSFSSMVEAERFAQKFADANDCILTITD